MQQDQNPINPIKPNTPNNKKQSLIIIAFVAVISIIIIVSIILIVKGLQNTDDKKTTATPTVNESEIETEKGTTQSKSEDQPTDGMIKVIDGITYVNGILIANKSYAMPSNYAPGVDDEANKAFETMSADAQKDGISLKIVSAYRSYEYQESLYNKYVNLHGKEEADRFSARPGYSEHQTGLSFDINSLEQSFEDTPEGKWLKDNCYKYGFIIRYPKDKENVTGYMYEPWHIRYLGVDIATAVFDSGLCLEEYLGIVSVYAEQ